MNNLRIGDKVTRIGFTGSFGDKVEPMTGLTIQTITKIKPTSKLDTMPVYYRIKATSESGLSYSEAAARFFIRD